MARERLPDRRASWTQKVHIDNKAYYLNCGEYPDGRLGEIFIDAHKEGTFSRGVLSALARLASIALQCGAPVDQIVKALRHLNFPPRGSVEGSENVKECSSLCDWIAQEIERAYCQPANDERPAATAAPADPPPTTGGEASPSNLGTTPESSF